MAMHNKNTAHSGVIELCDNGEFWCNLYFVQLQLSNKTKSKFKIAKLVIRFWQISGKKLDQTGPDQKSAGSRTGPDWTGYPVSS
jgi:hypothetical protein